MGAKSSSEMTSNLLLLLKDLASISMSLGAELALVPQLQVLDHDTEDSVGRIASDRNSGSRGRPPIFVSGELSNGEVEMEYSGVVKSGLAQVAVCRSLQLQPAAQEEAWEGTRRPEERRDIRRDLPVDFRRVDFLGGSG